MKKIVLGLLAVCCLLTGCKSAAPEASTASQTEAATATTVIAPLTETMELSRLDNCTVAVSLKEGDAYVDDTGAMQMKVTVYTYDRYDPVDIAALKEGDILVIGGQEVPVVSAARDAYGAVLINGGYDAGGYELRTDEDGTFHETGPNDAFAYHSLGEATVRVSPDFVYTDGSDPEKGEVIYYPGDFLVEGTGIDYGFTPYDTSIVIENGQVIAMNRVYRP